MQQLGTSLREEGNKTVTVPPKQMDWDIGEPLSHYSDIALRLRQPILYQMIDQAEVPSLQVGRFDEVMEEAAAEIERLRSMIAAVKATTIFSTSRSASVVTGTKIRTTQGDVSVEDLKVGTMIVTTTGAHRPAQRLSHRTLHCPNHSRPKEVYPVQIVRDAFAKDKPSQDLYVSPYQLIGVNIIDELLIPAVSLANGAPITQVKVDQITYWDIELETHDVMFANGLPCASYLDIDNPDTAFCRQYVDSGRIIDVALMQLFRRADISHWTLDESQPLADLHILTGGTRIDPVVRGRTARFAMPAGVGDAWLVSWTSRPSDVWPSSDTRTLGIDIRRLTIWDAFGDPDVIAIDSPLLDFGFSHVEKVGKEEWHRWTTGHALLPAALWDRFEDQFFLVVELGAASLPRWVMPPTPFTSVQNPDAINDPTSHVERS